MMKAVHRILVEAGMPDDRVDYILKKWVKYAYPEAFSKQNKKPDAQGCYDKGEHGVWCPKGDDWYCAKNCKNGKRDQIKPDAKGCYDKGEHGVWCPKGDEWHCVKNCKNNTKKQEVKQDAKRCYDKGEYGVWCP